MAELARAEARSRRTGKPARYFKEFRWLTRESWSRERRVIAKAEFTKGEANPRFVVTSLTRAQCKPKYLYEKVYCARGEMENRIKECQTRSLCRPHLDRHHARQPAAPMVRLDGVIKADKLPIMRVAPVSIISAWSGHHAERLGMAGCGTANPTAETDSVAGHIGFELRSAK